MGVNTARILAKLSNTPLTAKDRKLLVSHIVTSKKKSNPSIKVYSWDVRNSIAREVFLSKKDTLTSWCTAHKVWNKDNVPTGAVLYSWSMPIKEIFKYASKKKVTNVPIGDKTVKIGVSSLPVELYSDLHKP